MKRSSFILCCIIAFSNLTYGQSPADQAVSERIKQVENSLGSWIHTDDSNGWNIQDRMAFHKVFGLSIAVIRNYKVEWAKGYGYADTANRTPVTVTTLFQAASMSKSINSVGIVKLAQDKKIDLYTDINQYLKSWKFPYDSLSKNKPISVANLLSHTAGLSVHGFLGYTPGDSLPTIYQILDGVRPANSAPVRSVYEPGSKFEYSGGGTMITELLAMEISGQPYDKYISGQVLKPLGMNNSFFTQPAPKGKEKLLTTAYDQNGKEIKGRYNIYPEEAPAGLWTTPTDYSKYIIETQLSYEGKSSKVLTPSFTQLRLTPYIDSSVALGSFIRQIGDRKYFNHSGGNIGYRCNHYGSLSGGDGVVVMINSDNGMILDEIINSVAKVYGWKDFYKPIEKHLVKLTEAEQQRYIGNYNFMGDAIKITRENGDLYLSFGEMNWKMTFTSATDFFVYEHRELFQFQKDENGVVKGFTIGTRGLAEKK